jgi:hypothetical protein
MRGKKMIGGSIIITDLEDGSYICGSTVVKDEDLSKYQYVKEENKKEPNVIGLYKANGIAYFIKEDKTPARGKYVKPIP